MGYEDIKIQKGFGTVPSPLVEELLARDAKPIEPALLATGNYQPQPKRIPVKRYFDRDFATLEMEKLWKKSWQVVGREEDIPQVGDRMTYDVGELSYVILRDGPDSFRALENTCLHRGTRLCDGHGSSPSIRCPFHAWEWNLDGSLKRVPSRWDFPQVTDESFRLPEARIDRWGGHLFINPDPEAGPLSEALGVLQTHFRPIDAADRYTIVFARKKMRGNWKTVMEAFLEAYHVIETHADLMGFTGDASTQYEIWDDGKAHVSRLITPAAVPSPHLGDDASGLAAAAALLDVFAAAMGNAFPVPALTSELAARAEVAAWRRSSMSAVFGHDFTDSSDSYMLDSNQYFMFPNFFPWMGEGTPLSYQFMPLGSDPNQCMMEIRLTAPIPDNGPRPPAAEPIDVDFDEPMSTIPAFGILARVFDQDFSNLPNVQRGLKSRRKNDSWVTFGRYQESRIQHFHEVLEKTLGLRDGE
jgi:phenylpropionate dioxygenase-like ring-hydroxylating dioxygenase large terminal subunit